MNAISQNEEGSATAPTVPSHGPTNPKQEIMNEDRYTTAETEKEQQPSQRVTAAAQWLADQLKPSQPVIPDLRKRFALTAMEATEACALANRYRVFRRAHG